MPAIRKRSRSTTSVKAIGADTQERDRARSPHRACSRPALSAGEVRATTTEHHAMQTFQKTTLVSWVLGWSWWVVLLGARRNTFLALGKVQFWLALGTLVLAFLPVDRWVLRLR